jgi:hypothetical protein
MARAQSDAIDEKNRRRLATPRDVFLATVLGAGMLLVFCSRELPAWAAHVHPEMLPYAQKIDDVLSGIGLAAPYDAIHAFAQRLAG